MRAWLCIDLYLENFQYVSTLLAGLTMYQKERKNLIDDLPPVDSVGKLTDG